MRLLTCHIEQEQERIAIEIESEAQDLARTLLAYLDSQIRSGARFKEGQTIEFGWSLLLLRKSDDELELWEPDFESMPIHWCRGINNTVRQLHLQRAVCELFECEPLFPSLRHAGVVSPEFAGSRAYQMSRDQPVDSDSGWVLAESGYQGSDGRFCSLYQLALGKIEMIPFLALPPSSQVIIEPGIRRIFLNGVTKSSDDCELLRSLAATDAGRL